MVLRNSFMQKYADSQRSELRYHAEAEEMRWFLIRQNMRKYIHYRWNIFFTLIFQECIPDGIITLALDKKFLYIKE